MSLRCESEAFGPGRRRPAGPRLSGCVGEEAAGSALAVLVGSPAPLGQGPRLSRSARAPVPPVTRRWLRARVRWKDGPMWEDALTTRPGASAGSADRATLRSLL